MKSNKHNESLIWHSFYRIFPSTLMQLARSWTSLTSYRSTWSCLLALGVSWSKKFQSSTRAGWSELWAGPASTSAPSQMIFRVFLAVRPSPCSASAGRTTAKSTAREFSSASMEATATCCYPIDPGLSTICACTLKIAPSRALILDATRNLGSAATCDSTSRRCTRGSDVTFARNVIKALLRSLIVIVTRKNAGRKWKGRSKFWSKMFEWLRQINTTVS